MQAEGATIPDRTISGTTVMQTWTELLSLSVKYRDLLGITTVTQKPLTVETKLPPVVLDDIGREAYPSPENLLIKPTMSFPAGSWLRLWPLRPTKKTQPQLSKIPSQEAVASVKSEETFDQLLDIAETLRLDPHNERTVAILVSPELECKRMRRNEDYPFPRFCVLDFKIINSSLHLMAYLRSCEAYPWWIVNAVQLTVLLTEVKKTIGSSVTPGVLITHIGRVRIPQRFLSRAKDMLNILEKPSKK